MPIFNIGFRPLAHGDLPLFHEWLTRPHVAEWWVQLPTMEQVVADYGPSIDGTMPFQCFIASDGDEPIGFIQSYTPAAWHHEGWWLDENDPGVRGIDQFLADGARLGQGLGTAMIRAFVDQLFADATVTRVQTDPAPENARAIRCYEKCGFRVVREIDTPDGRALLMYRDPPRRIDDPGTRIHR